MSTLTRRTFGSMGLALLTTGLVTLPTQRPAKAVTKFRRVPTQYVAALADPRANSGTGAETWAIWRKDPGPRAVLLHRFKDVVAAGGYAPAKWKFDETDWWLDENGLLMERPDYNVTPGQYVVTGDRETVAILTVHPKDEKGAMRWELDRNAQIHDVTHLKCRSARYTPATGASSCSPTKVQKTNFPVKPGGIMPDVAGCNRQDYAVLFIIGVSTKNVSSLSSTTNN